MHAHRDQILPALIFYIHATEVQWETKVGLHYNSITSKKVAKIVGLWLSMNQYELHIYIMLVNNHNSYVGRPRPSSSTSTTTGP